MSSRVLRKLNLQGDKDLSCLGDDGSDTEADFSSSSGVRNKKLNINRYELLNQQSHSESEVKEDDDHETAGSLNAEDGAVDVKDASRKKKKKKRRKPGKVSNARSSEDNIEDEIERSVREVNEMLGEVVESELAPSAAPPASRRNILAVEHRSLNPNNELRRIFGISVVRSEQQVKRRGRDRGRTHLRSTWLVTPKDNWPLLAKSGLSMKLVEKVDGIHWFAFDHGPNYRQIQLRFFEAVDTLNPDTVVALINAHPYHIDALLQMSELFTISDDLSMAADLIERAVYALEGAFHPSFSLSAGNCRIDYRRQENRALFIALFKHLRNIGNRACYRTALEFCKVILSLDPDRDPLAIILAMDFYALKASEYQWFIKFYEEWQTVKLFDQLPNMMYSLSLAYFHLGKKEDADNQLELSLLYYPGVLLPLLEACSLQPSPEVAASTFFTHKKQSAALSTVEKLYVVRSHHLWKESKVMPWLDRVTKMVLKRIESGDDLDLLLGAEWRTTKYKVLPINVCRHLILSEFKEGFTAARNDHHNFAGEEVGGPGGAPRSTSLTIFGFDPFPPSDSIDIYSRVDTRSISRTESSLAEFFRTILEPNNQVPSDDQEDEAGGTSNGNSTGGSLRRSVVTLIDTMRDLLSNIHLPGDGDVEDDADSDQATP